MAEEEKLDDLLAAIHADMERSGQRPVAPPDPRHAHRCDSDPVTSPSQHWNANSVMVTAYGLDIFFNFIIIIFNHYVLTL